MKKSMIALMMVGALAGCDEANKAIDKAQEAATSAAESIQEKIDEVDLEQLNLDSLGEASESAKEFAASMQEVMNANLADASVLEEMQEKVANSYSCLVDATSESTAEKLLNKFMAAIGNEDTQSMIERAVEKAKDAKECVM